MTTKSTVLYVGLFCYESTNSFSWFIDSTKIDYRIPCLIAFKK